MKPDASQICFGLNEAHDQSSCALFLQLCGQKEFAENLSRRLSSKEIENLTNSIMALIKKHLNEKEYHQLFLQDKHH